ncbi:MAG: tetratricopeptide repeat protein, partial [Candidatus Accumulibacter sp.]|nr:tetratricopeptide repeat protein [Accumulibacter sp.]
AGAASSGEFAARENRHPALLPEQAIAAQEEMAREQAVYEVLLAEVALQRGNIDLAIQTYADLAQRTRDPQILERTVEVAEFARRFDLARKTAQLWLDIDPASQRARKMLTSVLIASNRLNELAPHLIRVLENDMVALPGNLLGLNALFARNTDRLAVFRLIDAVCQPFSGFAEAHYAVALAATGAYMGERARREMIQALELRPDWEAAALLYAQLLMRESSDEAVEFMENFLKDNPGAAQARLLFARILIGEHRHTDARHQFDRLLRDAPDDPEVVYAVAMLALQSGDKAFAETRLRSLVTIDKTLERNAAHYFLGQIAEDDERVDEAVAHYAQVASGEHHLPARMRQAALLFAQGKIDEGRESLRDASTDRPEERIRVQIVEAALLRDAGRVQEAFDFLEQQLAENPEHSDFLYETALLAERLNRMELMENRLRRVIELIPDNPQAYNALGYAYADRNMRLPEARQLIEKALALAPDDAAILDSMGWVLFRQGDLQGALSYLERSYGRLENPEIAAHLSEVLWSMGRRDDALRMLSDAQKKFPYNAVLSETVRRLAPE